MANTVLCKLKWLKSVFLNFKIIFVYNAFKGIGLKMLMRLSL